MDIKMKLLDYKKKKISRDELASLLKIEKNNTEELFNKISELLNNNMIEPVSTAKMNGNRKYPMCDKYRITLAEETDIETMKLISRLHPLLQKTGYLSTHPKEYLEHKDVIDTLNTYLFMKKTDVPMSRKERSYEIFGAEKMLESDNKEVSSLLNHLKVDNTTLNFYDTPEYCFHDYIPVRKNNLTLLICENKDIWFNIRRCMFEDGFRCLFGVTIDGVVFGNGNKVSSKDGLVEYVKFMGAPNVKFLYWGDIDNAGFDIYTRAKEANAALNIELFIPGYRKMLEKAENTPLDSLEDCPVFRRDISFEDLFVTSLTEKEQTHINSVLDANKRIPQEIITYTALER